MLIFTCICGVAHAQLQQVSYTTSLGAGGYESGGMVHIVVAGEAAASDIIGRNGATKLMAGFIPANFIDTETGLKRDSLALVALYDSMGGGEWSNASAWKAGDITTWEGVNIENLATDYPRVTGLSLTDQNLTGEVPQDILTMDALKDIDFSNNHIISLADLSSSTGYSSFDLSQNELTFASLEANADIPGINYQDQAPLTPPVDTLLSLGDSFDFEVNTDGTSNMYQWYRNNTAIPGAENSTYAIASINRDNQGEFYCEVTNDLVPNLTLRTDVFSVYVKAPVITGTVYDPQNNPLLNNGTATLFKVNSSGAYDTVSVQALDASGSFTYENLPWLDYILLATPDQGGASSLKPTYYTDNLLWEDATTLILDGSIAAFDIVANNTTTISGSGQAAVTGVFTGVGETGIANTPVMLWQASSNGQPDGILQGYELKAYTFTDSNGNFSFNNLTEGTYRIHMEYPGLPMDNNSAIDIAVSQYKQTTVSASIVDNMIFVNTETITGLDTKNVYPFKVYPNPMKDQLIIDWPQRQASDVEIVITDNLGKVAIRKQWDGQPISVEQLKGGIYYLHIVEKYTDDLTEPTVISLVKF